MPIEENKALSRRFLEEFWNQKNLAVVNELLAADYINHLGPPGLPPGREGLKQLASIYITAFPDVHVTIEDQIAEGDRVVSRLRARGTHLGYLQNIPPTGKPINITGIAIDRVASGKIVEGWANFDELSLMRQIGVIAL
jgi:steroid delta-isomerase-like uncharacterized protein